MWMHDHDSSPLPVYRRGRTHLTPQIQPEPWALVYIQVATIASKCSSTNLSIVISANRSETNDNCDGADHAPLGSPA
ncbi:hypothetical protein BO94DRAFT_538218 [Aspergillus sclerotioniger CBS 115572]|uniref:Uncharacterized protein n=1 Tax=Aspergillus sclerotioniger CBS 115572 TaxID=1450535 RepID=A0A317VPR2_9EURO|nr:hypothetical protein BO94DRAFT_538218 [Aspergillus sclerotioniger CBS 115572]PWY76364.1 hypothetical protein BO94DRAFT_538218 [Aspergillus sclerotioniger CBS 115572]